MDDDLNNVPSPQTKTPLGISVASWILFALGILGLVSGGARGLVSFTDSLRGFFYDYSFDIITCIIFIILSFKLRKLHKWSLYVISFFIPLLILDFIFITNEHRLPGDGSGLASGSIILAFLPILYLWTQHKKFGSGITFQTINTENSQIINTAQKLPWWQNILLDIFIVFIFYATPFLMEKINPIFTDRPILFASFIIFIIFLGYLLHRFNLKRFQLVIAITFAYIVGQLIGAYIMAIMAGGWGLLGLIYAYKAIIIFSYINLLLMLIYYKLTWHFILKSPKKLCLVAFLVIAIPAGLYFFDYFQKINHQSDLETTKQTTGDIKESKKLELSKDNIETTVLDVNKNEINMQELSSSEVQLVFPITEVLTQAELNKQRDEDDKIYRENYGKPIIVKIPDEEAEWKIGNDLKNTYHDAEYISNGTTIWQRNDLCFGLKDKDISPDLSKIAQMIDIKNQCTEALVYDRITNTEKTFQPSYGNIINWLDGENLILRDSNYGSESSGTDYSAVWIYNFQTNQYRQVSGDNVYGLYDSLEVSPDHKLILVKKEVSPTYTTRVQYLYIIDPWSKKQVALENLSCLTSDQANFFCPLVKWAVDSKSIYIQEDTRIAHATVVTKSRPEKTWKVDLTTYLQ